MRNRPGTCGQPWPDTVAIVGEDGRPLPAGERDEILARGPREPVPAEEARPICAAHEMTVDEAWSLARPKRPDWDRRI